MTSPARPRSVPAPIHPAPFGWRDAPLLAEALVMLARTSAAIAILDTALDALWRRNDAAQPGLIFYLAGADPHVDDRLGRLALSADGLAERDRRVFAAARERGIAVASSMAGGYGRVVEQTVALQLATLRAACDSWQRWQASARTPA